MGQSNSQRRRSRSYSLWTENESRELSGRSHKSLLDDIESEGSHCDLQSFTPPPSDNHTSETTVTSNSVDIAFKDRQPNVRKHSTTTDAGCSTPHSCGGEELSNLEAEAGFGERRDDDRSPPPSRTNSIRPPAPEVNGSLQEDEVEPT